MKTIKLVNKIVLLLLVNYVSAQSVNIDTIKLNPGFITTLEFSSNVEYTVVGNNPYRTNDKGVKTYQNFIIKEVGNVIIIRTLRANVPLTNIIVKTNNSIYHGILNYDNKPTKHFYSFKSVIEEKKVKEDSEIYQDGVETYKTLDDVISDDVILERMNITEKKENKYTIVEQAGGVIFQIGQIINDNQYNYIKLVVQNSSSSTYRINGVLFRYEEGKAGLFNKKNTENVEWLNPVKINYPTNKTISAYNYENIIFAIPVFGGKDGNMIIKILEESGTRAIILKVKADVLNSTEIFE